MTPAIQLLACELQTGATMKTLHLSRVWFLALALTSATYACGDDDDDDNGGTSGTAGRSTAGRGGSSGASSAEGGEGGRLGGTAGTTNVAAGADTGGTSAEGGAAGAGDAAGAAGQGSGGEGGAAVSALSDAQVLLVLDTVNQGEVEVAYAALPHLAAPDVRDFAQQMIDDHSAARQSVLSVADALSVDPAPSDLQAMLKAKAEKDVAMFHASESDTLDKTYIDAEVMDHAEALEVLGALDEAADAPELKDLIATLSQTVQSHYDEAVDLQAALP
jgi:putative membrane protein